MANISGTDNSTWKNTEYRDHLPNPTSHYSLLYKHADYYTIFTGLNSWYTDMGAFRIEDHLSWIVAL